MPNEVLQSTQILLAFMSNKPRTQYASEQNTTLVAQVKSTPYLTMYQCTDPLVGK